MDLVGCGTEGQLSQLIWTRISSSGKEAADHLPTMPTILAYTSRARQATLDKFGLRILALRRETSSARSIDTIKTTIRSVSTPTFFHPAIGTSPSRLRQTTRARETGLDALPQSEFSLRFRSLPASSLTFHPMNSFQTQFRTRSSTASPPSYSLKSMKRRCRL